MLPCGFLNPQWPSWVWVLLVSRRTCPLLEATPAHSWEWLVGGTITPRLSSLVGYFPLHPSVSVSFLCLSCSTLLLLTPPVSHVLLSFFCHLLSLPCPFFYSILGTQSCPRQLWCSREYHWLPALMPLAALLSWLALSDDITKCQKVSLTVVSFPSQYLPPCSATSSL